MKPLPPPVPGKRHFYIAPYTLRLFAGCLLYLSTAPGPVASEDRYRFDAPECIHTDSQMTEIELANGIGSRSGYNPYVDHSLWAVRQPGGTRRFYYRSMLHQSYHEGHIADRSFFGNVVAKTLYLREYTDSWKNPMRKRFRGVAWPREVRKPPWGIPTDQMEFVSNVYALSEKELIGFVHAERCVSGLLGDESDPSRILDRLYAIGISRSTNGGRTWTYCGDAVLPHWDAIGDTTTVVGGSVQNVLSNIGGIPYLVVPDTGAGKMVYLYFNELPDLTSAYYPAVARAPLDSVVAYARRGRVATAQWKKLGAGGWTESALYGCGRRALPPEPPECVYDTHADATFCSATGEYLLMVDKVDSGSYPDSTRCSLLLFSSSDGVEWRLAAELDRSCRYHSVYASFIGEPEDCSIDDHVVGTDFSIVYARRPLIGKCFDYAHPDLYMIRVHASTGRGTD